MSYGYVNTEALEQKGGGSGVKVGLNKGTVTGFTFNPNGGAGGSAQECVDVEITIEGREKPMNKRYFPITKVYGKEGNEITDPTNDEFKVASEQLSGTLQDIVGAVAGADAVKAALSRPIASFKEYITILENVYKATPGANAVPVDVFLSYEWKIRGENKQTFLTLPDAKLIKHGRWIIPAVNGDFQPEITSKGLRYVMEGGIAHPFSRSDWFVKSAYFKVTRLAGDDAPAEGNTESTPKAGGW